MLEVKNLTVRFGNTTIINDISFSVSPGQWLMVVGPNGAGKTTIISAVSRAVPYTGQVLFDGTDVQRRKSRELAQCMGVLSQSHYVGYGFTVEEVIRLGRYAHAPGLLTGGRDDGEKKVLDAIEKTGLESCLRQSVLTLSGGELQRFCVARALLCGADYLICDEVSTMLDAITQAQLWKVILEEAKRRNMGILAVTHNKHLAGRIAERTIDLSA